MADKKGGLIYPNPRNETMGGAGPEDPDISGAGLYGDLNEVMAAHLTTMSFDGIPNIEEGQGIMGGPASGEPNPYGFATTNQTWKGGKS
jgi:hypothetical protein